MSDRTLVKRILILAANPKDATRRRIDEEVREIDIGLKLARQRDQFDLQQRWAVRPKDIRRALLELNPQIIHFCGYGDGANGLAVENDAGQMQWIPPQALVDFFKQFAAIECVLLNACYAEEQAAAISQYIPYVIGMSQTVEDRAAIEFAVGFYDALGAGRSYEQAFQLGRSAIALYGIPDHAVPRMKHQVNLRPQVTQEVAQSRRAAPSSKPASTSQRVSRSSAKSAAPRSRRQRYTLAELGQKIWWVLLAIVLVWVGVGTWRWSDAAVAQLQAAKAVSGAVGGLFSGVLATVARWRITSILQAEQLILNCLIGVIAGLLGWLAAAGWMMSESGYLVGFFAGVSVALILLWRLNALKP